MKAPRYITLTIGLSVMACMAIAGPSALTPAFPSPTADLEPALALSSVTAAALPPTATANPVQESLPMPVPTWTASMPAPIPSTGWFELVGYNPLLNRGMNAAPAVYGNYVYIGSRTDGSHLDAGVLVVDISNPANPQVVYQIGPPVQGNIGETSRELRVWPEQEILLVLNFDCSPGLHACAQPPPPPNITVYDISGANAAAPAPIAVYPLRRTPHEMFLWEDPKVEGRALLYVSTPARFGDNLLVLDISRARQGIVEEVGSWREAFGRAIDELHSLSLSVDGRRAYLAHLQDGFMILDTSDHADAIPNPEIRLLTPPQNWARSAPGAHSAVKLFGKPYALITEEVYGRCPWGWARFIDITDEARPQFVAEYKLNPYNTREHCAAVPPERYRFTSFSTHNPTLTRHLAFITWHSGGLQAVLIDNPLQPVQVAEFLPAPLPFVGTEDPALSSGPDKVVMWSYPIIKDGLIYVVDVRNGLYILRYHGPFAEEVAAIHFLEGNSNLEQAQLWEAP